jgi:hypothetical protein
MESLQGDLWFRRSGGAGVCVCVFLGLGFRCTFLCLYTVDGVAARRPVCRAREEQLCMYVCLSSSIRPHFLDNTLIPAHGPVGGT